MAKGETHPRHYSSFKTKPTNSLFIIKKVKPCPNFSQTWVPTKIMRWYVSLTLSPLADVKSLIKFIPVFIKILLVTNK